MSTRIHRKFAHCNVLRFVIILISYISTILILVVIIVKLTPDQAIAEGNPSTFTCTAPGHEHITSYIWKLNDTIVPDENKEQNNFNLSRTRNGTKLSCAVNTAAGVASEESQVILQVFCK